MPQSKSITIWDVRRSVLNDYERYSSLPNISHLTIGNKQRKGKVTKERSVIAYVKEKLPNIQKVDRFPTSINCFCKNGKLLGSTPTDVIESPTAPVGFGLRTGHLLRGFDDDTGVCALAYRNTENKRRLLTNAHVVIDVQNGGVSGKPSFFNRFDNQYYQLGEVLAASELKPGIPTSHDVAVIDVPSAYEIDTFMILDMENDIDEVSGISTLSNHVYWYVVNGEKFECVAPERVLGPVSIIVDGVVVPYNECWQLRMSTGAARPGQSGALLCRNSGNKIIACGLIFGGIEPHYIFAFPFYKIWQKVKSI